MNLKPEEVRAICAIVRECLSGLRYELYVFGSRAKGSAHSRSDVDLLVKAAEEIPLSKMGELREAFDESDLTFKVDISDYSRMSESFQAEMLKLAKRVDGR